MKKLLIYISLLFLLSSNVKAQSQEAQQLLLNVTKLTQFKQILTDMKKGYKIVNGGYTTIKNLSEGNFNIHQTFLDGLMQVNPVVKNYKKVVQIVNTQLLIVKTYKASFLRFKKNDLFNLSEISYISGVYSNLLKKSVRNLEDLTNIITANKLRMSDDERLKEIDRIYDDTQDCINFLHYFNNETSMLALNRSKEKNSINTMQKIYGVAR